MRVNLAFIPMGIVSVTMSTVITSRPTSESSSKEFKKEKRRKTVGWLKYMKQEESSRHPKVSKVHWLCQV